MELTLLKVVLRYVKITHTLQSVMTSGMSQMPVLSVDNLNILETVSC